MAVKKKTKLKVPYIIKDIYKPMRHKVLYGGRGGCKTYGFADRSIIRCVEKKTLVLCAREVQNSIKDSVHAVLKKRIKILGFEKFFHITEKSITGLNGSSYIFKGLRINCEEVKSTEGIDICWVEEAENVSEKSWEDLIPTIREDNSEIWVGFNPKRKNSATYRRWVINTPPKTLKIFLNYWDNPYFPQVLRDEMEHMKATNYQKYLQIWCGQPLGIGARIYPKFDKNIHVRDLPFKDILEKGNNFMAIDPHSKYFPAVLFMSVIPKNTRMNWPEDFYKYVYAEWPTPRDMNDMPYHEVRHDIQYEGTMKQMATNIFTREGLSEGVKIKARYVDTRYAKGAGGRTMTTVGLVEEWAKEENGGIVLEMPREKFIDIQREKIISDLDYNKAMPISQFNDPNLVISPSCQNLIYSLDNHSLADNSEKEDEEYKDYSDALRILYAGLTDFTWSDPQEVASVNRHRAVMGGGGFFG